METVEPPSIYGENGGFKKRNEAVSSETQAIFTQALALPAASRADLVELLLSSIERERPSVEEIDAAWAREANDRFHAFLQGKIDAQPKEEVTQALRARHAK